MNVKKAITAFSRLPALVGLLALTLVGCGSSDEETVNGSFQLYNASANAPALWMSINVDERNRNHGPAVYGQSTSYFTTAPGTYNVELIYQDTATSSDSVYETELLLDPDFIHLTVVTEDISAPNVFHYAIPVDDPETEEQIFNVRLLNVASSSDDIDVYVSNSKQTFAQAHLFGQYTFGELSKSKDFDLDDYIYYITLAGSDEVLYQSEPIPYVYTTQYILAIRDNSGPGSSPYTIDRISSATGAINFPDDDSDAEYRIYNALTINEDQPEYQGAFDLILDNNDEITEILNLASHEFSDTIKTPAGDYSVDVVNTSDGTSLVTSNLLTLAGNVDKTSFIYLAEYGLGVDEDDDGLEDIQHVVRSLVVDTSSRASVFDTQVNVINLVDDFSLLDLYFVRNSETTETANFSQRSRYLEPQVITLLNNTYDIVAVNQINGNRTIVQRLDNVTFNANSRDKFLIFEKKDPLVDEYTLTLTDQKPVAETNE